MLRLKRVVLESPFAGDVAENERYARACLADCHQQGEAPIASHLLHTQPGVLDDTVAEERAKGIDAGHAWIPVADALVVYTNRGISAGMERGILVARTHGIPVIYRNLDSW